MIIKKKPFFIEPQLYILIETTLLFHNIVLILYLSWFLIAQKTLCLFLCFIFNKNYCFHIYKTDLNYTPKYLLAPIFYENVNFFLSYWLNWIIFTGLPITITLLDANIKDENKQFYFILHAMKSWGFTWSLKHCWWYEN